MDIYIMDYDVLRGTKDDLYSGLYESIPACYKNRRFINMYVENIPKEHEVLLINNNDSIIVMHVYNVVYYDRKVFVIVNNIDDDLRSIDRSSKELSHADSARAKTRYLLNVI